MRPLGEIDFACGSFVLRSLVIVSYRWGRELRELRAEPGRRQRDQADPCPSQAGCRSGFGIRGHSSLGSSWEARQQSTQKSVAKCI